MEGVFVSPAVSFLLCCLCCLCRAKYDVEVNTVRINIHFASDYSFVKGALAKVTVCVCHSLHVASLSTPFI